MTEDTPPRRVITDCATAVTRSSTRRRGRSSGDRRGRSERRHAGRRGPRPHRGRGPALVGVTDFDYLFPELVADPAKLLPADTPAVAANTVAALNDLGNAMIEQGAPQKNAPIPPIHTYWGQFVDHDLTAATDNDSVIGINVTPLTPMPPAGVVALLKNKRNPALNLDSVYGDGPFATAEAGRDRGPVPGGRSGQAELGELSVIDASAGSDPTGRRPGRATSRGRTASRRSATAATTRTSSSPSCTSRSCASTTTLSTGCATTSPSAPGSATSSPGPASSPAGPTSG